jgi:RimJ/RimL family protein N-acetyltransferase
MSPRRTDKQDLGSALPLHGDLVDLCLFRDVDITEVYLSWLNDPEVTRFSNQRFRRHDRACCERYLASFQGSDNLLLSIRRRDSGQAIGTMTLYYSPHHGTADVGILIGERTMWGNGYGQDAWNTVIQWLVAHESVRKITAGTLACNHGMVRVMERSGMALEAIRKNQEIVAGEAVDILYYAKFHAD